MHQRIYVFINSEILNVEKWQYREIIWGLTIEYCIKNEENKTSLNLIND